MLARLARGWPVDRVPGGLALIAQRWSTPVASWPPGLVPLASRAHAGCHAVVFVALAAAFFLLGLRLYQRARKATSE